MQPERPQQQPPGVHLKTRVAPIPLRQHLHTKIRILTKPIRVQTSPHPRQHTAQQSIVHTSRSSPIKRHPVHKLHERPLHIGHVLIAIHVLAIQVRHHPQHRAQFQKAAITLIRLRHQILRAPQPSIRPQRIHPPPHHHRRVKPPPASTAAIMHVVVVFPCIPATAIPYFSRISSASISAR